MFRTRFVFIEVPVHFYMYINRCRRMLFYINSPEHTSTHHTYTNIFILINSSIIIVQDDKMVGFFYYCLFFTPVYDFFLSSSPVLFSCVVRFFFFPVVRFFPLSSYAFFLSSRPVFFLPSHTVYFSPLVRFFSTIIHLHKTDPQEEGNGYNRSEYTIAWFFTFLSFF
jgi:hypothetical protein